VSDGSALSRRQGKLRCGSDSHLNIVARNMLVAALADFEGAMLFLSHDRHFIGGVVQPLAGADPGGVHQYGGGYTE